jgi:hypothetical protein
MARHSGIHGAAYRSVAIKEGAAMNEKPQDTRVHESDTKKRGLAQDLVDAGATAFVGTLGALGAKDAYGKAKDVLRPEAKEESPIILPPGTNKDE